MATADRPTLDQARDPLAFVYQETALNYDAYLLGGEYEQNYDHLKESWDEHYGNMRGATEEAVLKVMEKRSLSRHQIGAAIIGLGPYPVGRDVDQNLAQSFLSRLRSLVVVDFSASVIRKGIDQLLAMQINHNNLFHRDRVYGMQFDITDGLSTGYNLFIRDQLVDVQEEELLSRIVETWDKVGEDELDDRLQAYEAGQQVGRKEPEVLLRGGRNDRRNFKLSVDKEPMPLDVIVANEVLTATGAAAEDHIWEVFNFVTRKSDERAPLNDDTFTARKDLYRRINEFIARYNTEVYCNIVPRILQDNPQARLLATCDVATQHNTFGRVWRLNELAVQDVLTRKGIETDVVREWNWKDEPEHHHPVWVFSHKLGQTKRVTLETQSKIVIPAEPDLENIFTERPEEGSSAIRLPEAIVSDEGEQTSPVDTPPEGR